MSQACTEFKHQELKNIRTKIHLKLITDGMSVVRKKSFDSSQVTGFVFSSHIIVFRYLKLVKKTCVKESKH